MMATLQLTPDAAARLYEGPRFHRNRTAQENRQLVRDQIRRFKASSSLAMRYMGCILDAIQRLPTPTHQPA
jgi:hypothetical protein